MSEINDGLRPNYDFDFDAAIRRTIEGDKLEPEHEAALRRIIAGIAEPKKLEVEQETVITQ